MRGYKPKAWGRLLLRHVTKIDIIGDPQITCLQLNIKLDILSLLLAPFIKRDISSDFKIVLAVSTTSNIPAAQYCVSAGAHRLFIYLGFGKYGNY
jgi:methylglyoxal synthase